MRFHSHCPPEAAFAAADELGMMMQPELSHWNPRTAFLDQESLDYYTAELRQILRCLANHPSFVMLTFGNELWTDEKGIRRIHSLLDMARAQDSTRLYSWGSNVFYGTRAATRKATSTPAPVFHPHDSRHQRPGGERPRPPARVYQQQVPAPGENYDASMAQLRQTYQKPVFSFEVGQFEILRTSTSSRTSRASPTRPTTASSRRRCASRAWSLCGSGM